MSKVVIPFDENIRVRFAEPKPAWGRDKDGLIWLRCNCGHLLTLDPGHTISSDKETAGEVSPSLFHDQEFCGWHVFGVLGDWEKHPEG